MAKILLVEDEKYLRNTLKLVLDRKGYIVLEASNGEEAKDVLKIEKDINLIISDIRMPKLDGIQLLYWVKKTISIPVILMTGFSEIIETKEAYEVGAANFLSKPFEHQDLYNAIEETLDGTTAKESNEDIDGVYCKIPIESFVIGNKIPFNIFIKLGKTKIIKVANQGESISIDRIKSYKSKDVHFLYMKKCEFQKFIGFNVDLSNKISKNPKMSYDKKKKFISYTSDIIMEYSFVAGTNEELFSRAKDFLETAIDILADESQAYDLIEELSKNKNFLYAHSLGVSMYSIMLAKVHDWNLPLMDFKLSVAGLFHDIGKRDLDKGTIEENPELLNDEDRAIYQTHPKIGADIIKEIKSLPPDISDIILQHHELLDGTGFPGKLTKNQIHPLAKLLSVANIFCKYTIKSPIFGSLPAKDAITLIESKYEKKLDFTHVHALRFLFSFKNKN